MTKRDPASAPASSPATTSPTSTTTTTTTNQRACLGMLFYNQTRQMKGQAPLCTGISRRRTHPAPVSSSETMPAGDFKFVCLGYSVHEPDRLRNASATLKPGDPVEVPWCSGVEIISASAVSSQRELLPAGAQSMTPSHDRDTADASGVSDASLQRHQADRRKAVAPIYPHRGPDWEGFGHRYIRVANAIIHKMQANANYMVRSIERTWDQIFGKDV